MLHMLKDRASGVETAKCGATLKRRPNDGRPMTIWRDQVDCPACIAVLDAELARSIALRQRVVTDASTD